MNKYLFKVNSVFNVKFEGCSEVTFANFEQVLIEVIYLSHNEILIRFLEKYLNEYLPDFGIYANKNNILLIKKNSFSRKKDSIRSTKNKALH